MHGCGIYWAVVMIAPPRPIIDATLVVSTIQPPVIYSGD